MAQKDKVKELVGRGLGSYHTKVLQQMDRIEKKNKEQNHKINILTNELDNDYLTKTEEGSVISLEHSKEGMVYLDELQGNTLVNYCVDGSKELNLNGDIDVEGTSVTLTEGVDNGAVDVFLEGNTLVNVCNQKDSIATTKSYTIENGNHITLQGEYDGKCKPIIQGNTMVNYCSEGNKELTLNNEIDAEGTNITLNDTVDNGLVNVSLEGNTLVNLVKNFSPSDNLATNYSLCRHTVGDTYTVILDIDRESTTSGYAGFLGADSDWSSPTFAFTQTGTYVQKVESTKETVYFRINSLKEPITINSLIILEGDWTDKEIPKSYFEGMKSVGECEDNKIEILSRNSHNEIVGNGVIGDLLNDYKGNIANGGSADNYFSSDIFEIIEPNTQYYFWHSKDGVVQRGGQFIYFYDENKNLIGSRKEGCIQYKSYSNARYFKMMVHRADTTDIKFYVSKNNIAPTIIDSKLNKKEIILNEPLRSVGDVKDRIVKIGDKWYVERNCGFSLIDGNYDWFGSARVQGSAWAMQIREEIPNLKQSGTAICDKYSVVKKYMDNAIDSVEISSVKNKVILTLRDTTSGLVESSTEVQIQEKMKEITSNNPFKIVYQLEIPTYEEIIDPTLITYLDTTHISNNSIIPCNMKVQNSGYNTIIKPNTLYTVVLNTDVNGTIDVNLGGTKVTTTNNIATITTPSVLTNNNLELHGEGIKVSNAMVFEGDTTSNLPNEYVDGLMSCFEDQLVTDENDPNYGKYKVEYKVVGKNVFNEGWESVAINQDNGSIHTTSAECFSNFIDIKGFTTLYSLIIDNDKSTGRYFKTRFYNANYEYLGKTDVWHEGNRYIVPANARYLRISWYGRTISEMENVQVVISGTPIAEYEEYKEYTKAFYLNSPLLEGDTIEDINGKATHVKRYNQLVLDGSEQWTTSGNVAYIRKNDIPKSYQHKYEGDLLCNRLRVVPAGNDPTVEGTLQLGNSWFVSTYIQSTLDEFKLLLSSNPITVVYELASPIYETISEESILCSSYVSGHLDLDTNIPVEKVEFIPLDLNLNYLYPNTIYTIQFKSDTAINGVDIKLGGAELLAQNVIVGVNKFNITTPNTLLNTKLIVDKEGANISDVSVVTTELEIDYFEGIKSVGQDDVSGHGIEVLSKNKNLFNVDKLQVANGSLYGYMYLGENDNYTLSITDKDTSVDMSQVYFGFTKNGKNAEEGYHWLIASGNSTITTNTIHGDFKYFSFFPNNQETLNKIISRFNVQIEEGSSVTTYVEYKSNKKEILLNEPLRGLPNGLKDRFVKMGGKWYVEKNCGEVVLNGSEDWNSNYGDLTSNTRPNTKQFYINNFLNNVKNGICDNFANRNVYYEDVVGFLLAGGSTSIRIGHTSKTTNEFKQWLQENPTTIVYQLETPTYEEITDIELTTYLDTTYISNNSIIPCNMVIKNSGYDTIIKPNTQYTVAFDTNKSGTIGINLGGSKTTTTNNVATVTTPSILTDDSLRLYGKGINASKVRLLERDKTNYIPSYFEGMKSCFEDKLQEDGSYKMEILSNNENLFDSSKEPDYNGDMTYYNGYGGQFISLDNKEYTLNNYGGMAFDIYLPIGKTYYISFKVKNENGSNSSINHNLFLNKNYLGKSGTTFTTTKNHNVLGFGVVNYNEYTKLVIYDIVLSEIINSEVEQKQNKLQFSSIEPLRGIGDVKDRFVLKDGKLMIERNCGQVTLNGSEDWVLNTADDKINFKNVSVFHNEQGICGKAIHMSDRFIVKNENIDCELIRGGGVYTFVYISKNKVSNVDEFKQWLSNNPTTVVYQLAEPIYEEIPFELQKLILEGYENGTLFFDTNIPPTVTTTYSGETPIVKATRLNKSEVLNNTTDINDNIIPYLMDMDYRVVCLQLEGGIENISMARLFGGTYEMLQRDIQSKRYSVDEYKYRLDIYLSANKITEDEYEKLGGMLYE